MWVKFWVRIFGENHALVRGHDGTIGSGREVSDHKPSFSGEVGKVISRQPLEIIRGNIDGLNGWCLKEVVTVIANARAVS
jgi:hypothetical protein